MRPLHATASEENETRGLFKSLNPFTFLKTGHMMKLSLFNSKETPIDYISFLFVAKVMISPEFSKCQALKKHLNICEAG